MFSSFNLIIEFAVGEYPTAPIKFWMYCLGCHTTHTLVYFSLNGVKVTIYFGYNLSDILPYKKFIWKITLFFRIFGLIRNFSSWSIFINRLPWAVAGEDSIRNDYLSISGNRAGNCHICAICRPIYLLDFPFI